ncbi:MAG: S8 family serine peptidase [Desulfobulbaceae bacterium]
MQDPHHKCRRAPCCASVFLVFLLSLVVVPALLETKNALAAAQESPFISATYGTPAPLENNGSPEVKPSTQIEENVLDKGDYYILANGDRKHFFRKKDHYVLVYDKGKASAPDSQAIESRLHALFPSQAEVLRKHSLGRNMVVKVPAPASANASIIASLRSLDPDISFVSPLLTDKNGVDEIAILPRIIVRFSKTAKYDALINTLSSTYRLTLTKPLSFTEREYEFQLTGNINDIGEIFLLTRSIASEDFVEWVEPVLVISLNKFFTPNDPLFNNQWHLHNTGQNGGVADADVDAPEGWDLAQGSNTIIAIYDDGVQTSHPDLQIWINPGESGSGKEANGIDDDGNGFVDDYQGWDFGDGDNNPAPALSTDNHGTAVAGVAGGKGNNGIGISGSAVNAAILPVRSAPMTCTDFGNAMRYAARYADVVNNSWGIGACESELDSAIADAVSGAIPGARRGTKGTPVLFATGNSASGWRKFTLSGIPAGTHTFKWEYAKDSLVSEGYDTVWLDAISWPGGGATDFESDTVASVPSGFTSGGNVQWAVVSDSTHARGATGNSVKAGTISDSQTTYLQAVRSVGAGELTFWVWVSSEYNYDFFNFYFDDTRYFHYSPGQYDGHQNEVGYPASNLNTIAVGASTDGGPGGTEERSYYSQFGPEVDVVAPSSGGNQGITTTDRTGADGYDSGSDYTSGFGGTSSATPLVAGIAATILAYAPTLTAAELRDILHSGADQIGPYSYPAGRNDYYGYGRVNLNNSLSSISTAPTVTTQAVAGIGTSTATGNGTITNLGFPNPSRHGVCWNTTGTPTTDDDCTDEGAASAAGPFVSAMTGLTPGTTYHVRAYATNTAGTAYGDQVSFTTSPVAPSLTTQAVTSIGTTTATGNGTISDLGSPNPTQHGICWNTTGTPTVSDSCSQEGAASATGPFTSAMTGLTPGTTYHVRAYATNTAGTVYGGEVSFTTSSATPPTVTTQAVTSIGTTTATGNGTISDLGSPNPTQHGICWNTTGTPTVSDSCSQEGAASATGPFASAMTGLTPGTTYHVRAYATNIAGTVYGDQVSFTTAKNSSLLLLYLPAIIEK